MEKVKICFIGDIMLGRNIGERLKHVADPFKEVREIFETVDIIIGNLEAPFTNASNPLFKSKNPHLTFKVSTSLATVLKKIPVNALTLANNHITDYGQRGVMDTMDTLKKLNILYTGAGKNLSEATNPIIFNKYNIKIAMFAFNAFVPFSKFATCSNYGVAPFDINLIRKLIINYSSKVHAIILSIHWGLDYYENPIPIQRKLALNLLKYNKVMAIIGHHPHVVQPVEVLPNNKIIFYSLGNFIFDDPNPSARHGIIATLTLDISGITEYTIIPIYLTQTLEVKLNTVRNGTYFMNLSTQNMQSVALNCKWLYSILLYLISYFCKCVSLPYLPMKQMISLVFRCYIVRCLFKSVYLKLLKHVRFLSQNL